MRRVHQPDHGMIDAAAETSGSRSSAAWRRRSATRGGSRFRRRSRLGGDIDPDQSVLLAHRIMPYTDLRRDRGPGLRPARESRCRRRRGGSASHDRGIRPCSRPGSFPPTAARRDGDRCRAWRKPAPSRMRPSSTGSPSSISRRIWPGFRLDASAGMYQRSRRGSASAAINWGRRKRCRAAGRVAFPARPPWSSARRASSSKAAPCPATAYRPIRPRAH